MNFKAQPAQIRTSASTHTALMKDEWRGSGREDRDAGCGVLVPTCRRLESVTPTSSLRVDCDEPERFARADSRVARRYAADRYCREQHGIGSSR